MESEPVGGTHFHVNCFARSLVLTQRHKVTQKWAIKLLAPVFYERLFNSIVSISVPRANCNGKRWVLQSGHKYMNRYMIGLLFKEAY